MPNKVLLKKSSVVAKVPLVGDLDYGELALNYADEKLYFKNSTNQIKSFTPGSGTVTSVGGTGTVSGLTLSGTVTTSGNLTLGGTLAVTASNFASQTANTVLAAPNGAAGVPTFRTLVAADIPTLNQNTTGNAATSSTTSRLATPDTRNATIIPTDLSAGLVTSFQTNVSDGLSDGGTYNGLWSFRQYASGTDWTGGVAHQLGFTDNGNIWHRIGNSATWGTWYRLLDTNSTVAIANGGTGATTRQDAMDALAGAVTSGQYLRGNGTDVVMSAIQAADVPTLNQNTTGSAATLTTGRTIAITGDVSYTSPSFNGSADVTATATLANSGVTAGTYRNATIVVDSKGRITSASTNILPIALNDISSQFDGVKTVFALRRDQDTINTIVDSKDLEVVINGARLTPYVKQLNYPWLTEYDSFKGFKVSGGNLIIYNAPWIGDSSSLIWTSNSTTAQTRKYPYSATAVALGD